MIFLPFMAKSTSINLAHGGSYFANLNLQRFLKLPENDGLLSTCLVLVRHNEPEGSACLGALSEDGYLLWFLQSAAAHCQRLLQGDCFLYLPQNPSFIVFRSTFSHFFSIYIFISIHLNKKTTKCTFTMITFELDSWIPEWQFDLLICPKQIYFKWPRNQMHCHTWNVPSPLACHFIYQHFLL